MLKKLILALFASGALCGCAYYHLGTTLPSHLKTVSVDTFENRSGEPQIESTITSKVLQEFQRDGQLRVVNNGDILLDGTIVEYRIEPMRFDRNNPKATKEYKATIFVDIVATEAATGKEIVRQRVSGYSTFDGTGDLVTARRTMLPKAATDLAEAVVSAVISAW